MNAMVAVYRALGGLWEIAADVEEAIEQSMVPDRVVQRPVICQGIEGDEDDWENEKPCEWEGIADVQVFDDTEEALFWCPNNHENSVRYEDVA